MEKEEKIGEAKLGFCEKKVGKLFVSLSAKKKGFNR